MRLKLVFEDLVCAMMKNIKNTAENNLQQIIDDTVIGRPINFHGRGGNSRTNKQNQYSIARQTQI